MKIFRLFPLLFLLQGPARADGRQPPPKKPEQEQKSTLQDAKDSANHALENVALGVHQASGEIIDAANKALQNVDDTLHGRRQKDAK